MDIIIFYILFASSSKPTYSFSNMGRNEYNTVVSLHTIINVWKLSLLKQWVSCSWEPMHSSGCFTSIWIFFLNIILYFTSLLTYLHSFTRRYDDGSQFFKTILPNIKFHSKLVSATSFTWIYWRVLGYITKTHNWVDVLS